MRSLLPFLLVAACQAFKCNVSDGSGVSATYPCTCGTATCASDEICFASANACELIEGIVETDRGKATSCPPGYQVITDALACQQVAENISSKIWGAVYSYTTIPHGCGTRESYTVNYNINPGGVNTDVENALLCIRTSMKCDVSDGSGASSSYPCTCGTDTCAQDEVCVASEDRCQVIKGYYETDREAYCPSGYQYITDAAACRELAGKISSKTWGAVYSDTSAIHGCGTRLATLYQRVNYYVNHDGISGHQNALLVQNALLCISSSLTCDVSNGSTASSSYPCVCGTDTCATGEVCIASENRCEVIKGYYQTEREIGYCPSGYQTVDEAPCWELAKKLGKTWMKFPSYSGVAFGCGTWNFGTVSYFDYAGRPNPKTDPLYVQGAPDNVENSMLCVSENETISFDICRNPYSWGPCIASNISSQMFDATNI